MKEQYRKSRNKVAYLDCSWYSTNAWSQELAALMDVRPTYVISGMNDTDSVRE